MNKVVAAGAVVGVLLAGLPLMVMASGADPVNQNCVNAVTQPAAGTPTVATSSVAGLDATQLQNAATIVAVGRRVGAPDHGVVIALATGLQESRLRVYANDGAGGDLAHDQVGVSRSLHLPHQAVGSDHGSLGVFQQQWPWWGTMHDLMAPAKSARIFYSALTRVPGWERMPVTVAAQAVQHSAYPEAYADDEPLARRLLLELGGSREAGASTGLGADCATPPVGGSGGVVHFPLPAGSGYVDLKNFDETGDHWSSRHTGTDLSVACGTPVLAATSGTVHIRRDQPWAGPTLVQVATGPGKLTTWYAHMRRVLVPDGAAVSGGQQIGEVGDLGNATGCHLHFEVHPHGGTIYQDPVDPTTWLAGHVGRPVPGHLSGIGLVVATFNTLGASHTTASGESPQMASGVMRTRWALHLLDAHAVDVVGLQEFQTSQGRAFHRFGGDRYATWSPPGDTENTVAWRRSTIELVSATTVSVPYFDGRRRRMPVVRLRVRATGQEFQLLNVHNPADTARFHHQARWRAEATARELTLVASLSRTSSVPVLVTGDMNDTALAFCRFTATGQLTAAAGGTHAGSCRPPARPDIDWIFGSTRSVRFSSYTRDHGALVRRTTDHPVVLTRVGFTSP